MQRVIDAMQGSIRAKRAQVSVDELPAVWGDPTALEQVFANLVGNAVNYLDPARDGRIEIGTSMAPPGVQSLRIFYVRDNGLGIPEIALPRLFNAFQRLHGNSRRARVSVLRWCAGWSSGTAGGFGRSRKRAWARPFICRCPKPKCAVSRLLQGRSRLHWPT